MSISIERKLNCQVLFDSFEDMSANYVANLFDATRMRGVLQSRCAAASSTVLLGHGEDMEAVGGFGFVLDDELAVG